MLGTSQLKSAILGIALGALSTAAIAAPMTYNIDPRHTFPSFEADHQGLSYWRGKFNETAGTITMDKAAETGTMDITIQTGSIDFGLDAMNDHAVQADMFDVANHPTATYTGRLTNWVDGAPTAVEGEFTLLGNTRPLNLDIRKFACRAGRGGGGETCGADAYAEFDRADFGMDFGANFGMATAVTLRIQVEAASQ